MNLFAKWFNFRSQAKDQTMNILLARLQTIESQLKVLVDERENRLKPVFGSPNSMPVATSPFEQNQTTISHHSQDEIDEIRKGRKYTLNEPLASFHREHGFGHLTSTVGNQSTREKDFVNMWTSDNRANAWLKEANIDSLEIFDLKNRLDTGIVSTVEVQLINIELLTISDDICKQCLGNNKNVDNLLLHRQVLKAIIKSSLVDDRDISNLFPNYSQPKFENRFITTFNFIDTALTYIYFVQESEHVRSLDDVLGSIYNLGYLNMKEKVFGYSFVPTDEGVYSYILILKNIDQ